MSGLKFFKDVHQEQFEKKGRMRFYSSNEKGLTPFGFQELCTDPEEIKEKDLDKGMREMGYDDDLFSNKSRVFVLSIHTEKEIKLKIGDALNNNYQSAALNHLNDAQLKERGPGDMTQEYDDVVLYVN